MSDTLNAAIEEMRDQLADSIERIKQEPKMAEILRLHSALNTLEGLVGVPPTSLSSAFALEANTMVEPGVFYGMNPLKAAKRFLKIKGKPASLNEIVSAIREGGVVVKSIDKLRVSLGRSNQDVAKVGPDHYGLLEFYPHVQRGKKGKAEEGVLSLDDDDDDSDDEGEGKPPLSLNEDDIQEIITYTDNHIKK
jgi:hypothetical protein